MKPAGEGWAEARSLPVYESEPLSATLGASIPSFIDESLFCLEALFDRAAVVGINNPQ